MATAAIKTSWESTRSLVKKRIEQGKETKHFLEMFGNQIIVLQGGIESGFNDLDAELAKLYPSLGNQLFHSTQIHAYIYTNLENKKHKTSSPDFPGVCFKPCLHYSTQGVI